MKTRNMSFDSTRCFLAFLCINLFLVGCSNENAATLSRKSIIYCSEGSPESFNPQIVISSTTIDATSNQLYNSLITHKGDDNVLSPAIAKSWHITRDGTKITFYLRQDISFHQTSYFTPTRKLNADDVLFSFNRILDSEHEYHDVSGGFYPFFQRINFDELVEDIEKLNEYTVRFTLSRPDSSFLANLATDFAVILSKEYADNLSATYSQQQIDLLPIGTGPFKYKEYRAGSFIRYSAHENYWQKNINIEHLIFDITPSNTGRLTKLLAKECDVVSYPIAHNKITERQDLVLNEITSFNLAYLGFNTTKAPFNNKLVRKAISYAINKEAIIDAIYFGKADIASSIIPPASWAYDKNIPEQEYSISKAINTLNEAGYPDGFTMNLWAMPVERAFNPDALTMAKLIAGDLQKIGINVNIIYDYEWDIFLKLIGEGQHHAALLGWTADHPDPDNFFTPLLSCSSTSQGYIGTFWCNKAVDELIKQSLQTSDIRSRKEYYSEVLKIAEDEIPLIPIAHSKRFQGRSKNISGQLLKPFGGITFEKVKKN
ncbi:ABC transporter substrate-binding protein [Pseudocolwellia sp. HL-MZ19]|uniref:ABC transporter substrate-binding protein n=1 Tax=unclassified Pseudocolwellia TaxID=2848178 RepID=UPI003CF2D205